MSFSLVPLIALKLVECRLPRQCYFCDKGLWVEGLAQVENCCVSIYKKLFWSTLHIFNITPIVLPITVGRYRIRTEGVKGNLALQSRYLLVSFVGSRVVQAHLRVCLLRLDPAEASVQIDFPVLRTLVSRKSSVHATTTTTAAAATTNRKETWR